MNDDISSFPGAVAAILIMAFVLTIPQIARFIKFRSIKPMMRTTSK